MLKHTIFQALNDPLRRQAAASVKPIKLPPGQILFRAGEPCQGLPLVIEGGVRVQMTGVSGHSIVLYRMTTDDICTLSIGCLMTGKGYRAEAVVETDTEAMMIPRPVFDELMAQSADFRLGIMESYGRRLDDLMLLVEEVAFRRMDERLRDWLLDKGRNNPVLTVTHQALSVELGTAREVISRLLKEMERNEQVRLSRGRIELTGLLHD